ncbi:FAD-dependent monooxygenase [Deinococcus sp.]|uniref:FAD-dependent monooxygenase n=1 Tax=Deinococcus sp. TaxID=47478 RepID=UPI003C7AD11E
MTATPSEVLIVGAGPTGLMLAALLSRWGVVPRIIDSGSGPSQYSKATGVQARTLEAFQQLGLSDAAVEYGLIGTAVNLHNDQGPIGRLSFGDAGQGVSPFPYILILPQDRTEAILGDDLRTHGLNVEWNTRLEGLEQTQAGVQVTLSQGGQVETASYRYVLGADGARSSVRRLLNVGFQGETYDHLFFVADLRIDGEPVQGELNIFLSSVFKFAAMFPMKGHRRFRLVGVVPPEYVHLEHPSFEDLQPYFREKMGRQMQLDDVDWFATYRVHHRVAEAFKVGYVFLLGDAAHVHSPVGGQGMNTGLQDAYNLAWKLALVLRGQADAALLDSYHEERHPNAVKLVNTTDRIFSGFIASEQGWVGFVRRWVLPAVLPGLMRLKRAQRRAFDTLSQTALNYRGHRLSVDTLGGQVKAGDRFPWFTVGGQDSFARLSPTRFTLFALGGAAQLPGLDDLNSPLLEIVQMTEQAASGLTDGLYLVRPDGYIGLTAKTPNEMQAYLDGVLGLKVPSSTPELVAG